MTDRPKSIQEALAEVQRKVNEQRADRLANMMEAIPVPVPARRGEGVTGIALANKGISRENRRDQAYVDSVFGAGKMKAGSAESNLALLKHSKMSPSLGTQGPNQSGSAAPQVPSNATPEQRARGAEITQQDKERAAGASVADQRAAGENVSGSMRNVTTGLDSKNTGNVQADQSRADVASGKDTSVMGKVGSALTTSLAGKEEPPKPGAFGSKEDMAKEISKTNSPAPTSSPSSDSAATSSAANDVGSRLGGGTRTPNRTPAPSSDSPSIFSKVKDYFTKPTETKVGDNGIEPESGPKGKKKMSESALISAFLKLQETNHPNIFEAAKKAKKDYDGDGKIESGKDEYLGSRIAAAKKAGKMEEELKGDQDKIDANKNGKIDADDFRKLRSGKKSEKIKAYRADRDKHGEMEEAAYPPGVSGKDTAKDKDPDMLKGSPDDEAAEKKIPTPPKKPAEMKEETFPGFSEAEIAHFEAVIARKDQKGKDRGPGDVVASEDLTDEYINEMARGVKAGTKRGSYKGKAHKGGADAKGDSMPAEEPKGIPHVLDQIRHGREDEHGFKTITHPASSPEAPVSKSIHRSELHGFYDTYHNTEKPAAKEKMYGDFLGKHFGGDTRATAPTSKSVTTDLSKVEKANLKGGGSKPTLGGSKLVGGKN
jgi:hypothetical protein